MKIKLEQYFVQSSAADLFRVDFFDGQVVEMRMLYYAPKVNKLGGPDVLVDRLTDKFGKKPTYKKIGDEDWLI